MSPPRTAPPRAVAPLVAGAALAILALAPGCAKRRAAPVEPPRPSPPPDAAAPPASAPPPAATIPLDERRRITARIACIGDRGGERDVWLIGADGEGARRVTVEATRDFTGPAAPDGSGLLVISVEGEDGPQQLFFHPRGGGAPRRLGPPAGKVRSPSFTPDARSVIFESSIDSFSDLYRIGVDGRGLRRLTRDPEGNYAPDVSPRGDVVVLVSSRDRVAELYVMRPDGSAPRRLTSTPRDEWAPRFSPDGRTIAFASDRDGADRVYLMPAAGGAARRASRRDLDVHTVEDTPVFAPAGPPRLAWALRAAGAPPRIALLALDTGAEAVLDGEDAAFSPDGRFLAFHRAGDGGPQVWLARADGTGATPVTHPPGAHWHPQWLPAPAKPE